MKFKIIYRNKSNLANALKWLVYKKILKIILCKFKNIIDLIIKKSQILH